MPRQLDTRLDREEGRRTVGTAEQRSATIRQRRIWRAEASIGAVIRSALADAGVDVAQATRLCLADTPELQRTNGDGPAAAEAQDRVQGDDFDLKIRAMARSFADAPPPDFANASFAELFAWSLAQSPVE